MVKHKIKYTSDRKRLEKSYLVDACRYFVLNEESKLLLK